MSPPHLRCRKTPPLWMLFLYPIIWANFIHYGMFPLIDFRWQSKWEHNVKQNNDLSQVSYLLSCLWVILDEKWCYNILQVITLCLYIHFGQCPNTFGSRVKHETYVQLFTSIFYIWKPVADGENKSIQRLHTVCFYGKRWAFVSSRQLRPQLMW